MPAKFTNNASATIVAAISTTDTTIVLAAGLGSAFPTITGTDYFYSTLSDPQGNVEIVKVTARNGDTLTVLRGQDNTSPKAFAAGSSFALRLVAAIFNDFVTISSAQTIGGAKTFSNDVRINGVTGGYAGQFYLGDNLRVLRNGAATNDWEMVNADYSAVIFTFANNGNLTASGDITSSSDERLKSDIKTITGALQTVESLRGVSFTKDKRASVGLIAQEVQKIVPSVVHENSDGYLSVAYANLVGVLVEAVKELSTRVKELEKR